MKALWDLFCILAVVGTYYGAWQHNWTIMLLCFIPQVIGFGYKMKDVIK